MAAHTNGQAIIFCSCGFYLLSFWATVCKTVRPMLTDRCVCPVCLSVMFVYRGQTIGLIKMKLGMQVGPGHIVLG